MILIQVGGRPSFCHPPPSTLHSPLSCTSRPLLLPCRFLLPFSLLPENAHPALCYFHRRIMTTFDDYGMPVGAYAEPESLTRQALRVARAFFLYRVKPGVERSGHKLKNRNWTLRSFLTLTNVLVAFWFYTLYSGERTQFNATVNSCRWEEWERWVCAREQIRVSAEL